MSQKQVLLSKLREGPVCSFSFYTPGSGLTHRAAARVKDLRDDGWNIITRPCLQHDYHHAGAVEYILLGDRLFA